MINVQKFNTPHGLDKYIMVSAGDLPGLLAEKRSAIKARQQHAWGSWSGDTFESFERKLNLGDEKLVENSEKLLEKLEDQVPHSRGWRNVDDVVGALPIIPSYIAGHPMCMRRRERTRKDNAPLAIYMDLTSSGGINAAAITARGVTLLALTRVLVERRPVELWVGSSLGGHRDSGTMAWRIDTAPLDIARAAYHIGATAMSRGLGYGLCHIEMGTGGSWPFNSYDLHVRTAKDRLAAVLPGQEILYIPPIYLTDPMTTDPVGWIKRTLNLNTEEE